MTEVLQYAQNLLQRASVTPEDGGCLDFVVSILTPLGFVCEQISFGVVKNLYARFGRSDPHFCFAGHVDVVPPGNLEKWSVDPFGSVVKEGHLYGRGAVDMKGSIAAFLSATQTVLSKTSSSKGSLSFLLTSDEEGPAQDGTRRMVTWLKEKGEVPSVCLVGEPTNMKVVGDTIKVGRRGSINFTLTVHGKSGHVAYPNQAENPIPKMLSFLEHLQSSLLDGGQAPFDPSNLVVTSIDVDNSTRNVIPSEVRVLFNIRFNPLWSAESLTQHIRQAAETWLGASYTLTYTLSANPFYVPSAGIYKLLEAAIISITGQHPTASTSGGTSDARFIKDLCPVIEFGLVNASAHQADEHTSLDDLKNLEAIYAAVLKSYLLNPPTTIGKLG